MDSKGVILMYHRIGEPASDAWGTAVSPETFSEQLQYLCREYDVLRLERVATGLQSGKLPRRWVAVTFDDGYANNLYQAKPLLERHEVPATVFVVSGKIGSATEFWWDEIERVFTEPGSLPDKLELNLAHGSLRWSLGSDAHLAAESAIQYRRWRAWDAHAVTGRHRVYREVHSLMLGLGRTERRQLLEQLRTWSGLVAEARPEYRVMTKDELLELTANEHVDVGSHTVSHSPLHLLTGDTLRSEVTASKLFLEHVLSKRVAAFSYPFGSYVAETVEAVQGAGYEFACSSLSHDDVCAMSRSTEGLVHPRGAQVHRLYQIPRIMIEDWNARELSARFTFWFEN